MKRGPWRVLAAALIGSMPPAVLLGSYAALGPVSMYRVVVAGLAVCALAVGRSWRGERALAVLGTGWLVIGVVSGAHAGHADWGEVANLALGFVLAWSLARLRDRRTMIALAVGWEVSVLVSAPIAVWEHDTTRHLPQFVGGLWRTRPLVFPFPGTFFPNPNYYALFLAIGAAVMSYAAFASGRPRVRAAHGLACALTGYLLGMTGSVSCLLAVGCMVAALLLFERWGRVLVALGVVGIGGLVMGPWHGRATSAWHDVVAVLVHHADLGPTSWPVRLSLLAFGLALVSSHPWLGAGPGGFARLAAHPGHFALHHKVNPHNGLLHVAGDFGLPVAAALVAAWTWMVSRAWRGRRRDPVLARTQMALLLAAPALSVANSLFVGPNVVSAWMALHVLVDALLEDAPRQPIG
ncbi:O-antigen ligase family protein [Acidipropionibacterium timonense]|uniref:O-antigen ligase family protein n=1 Tax=Acidipropionibacterium timonense TaxID=2161818 RepID=UPI001FD8D932|nr:O-antigen ligase family protein [Acidipropionibacterium timonense]